MKSANLSREDLLQENRRLIKNLRARFSRQMGVELSAPIYAQTKFNELLQETPRDLSYLSDKELRTLNRDLNYIIGLKTATKRGAEIAEKEFEPIREFLEPYSEDIKRDWWKMFGKIYEHIGQSYAERFKYTVLDVNKEIFENDLTTEGFGERFAKIYNEYTASLWGGEPTAEGVRIVMSKEFGLEITPEDIIYQYDEYVNSLQRKYTKHEELMSEDELSILKKEGKLRKLRS